MPPTIDRRIAPAPSGAISRGRAGCVGAGPARHRDGLLARGEEERVGERERGRRSGRRACGRQRPRRPRCSRCARAACRRRRCRSRAASVVSPSLRPGSRCRPRPRPARGRLTEHREPHRAPTLGASRLARPVVATRRGAGAGRRVAQATPAALGLAAGAPAAPAGAAAPALRGRRAGRSSRARRAPARRAGCCGRSSPRSVGVPLRPASTRRGEANRRSRFGPNSIASLLVSMPSAFALPGVVRARGDHGTAPRHRQSRFSQSPERTATADLAQSACALSLGPPDRGVAAATIPRPWPTSEPPGSSASPPLFESGFLDFFSRIHPAVPALIFVPVIVALIVARRPIAG